MDVMYSHCCGIDIHQQSLSVCVLTPSPRPGEPNQEIRPFGTNTNDLLALSDWLLEMKVTHVAMESTGVFWKPVWNVLEGSFNILLVNATHLKQVPGRKTDKNDCAWIAKLLQHGLLKPSFVPPQPIRELRDLCRQRVVLVRDRAKVSNRIRKILEDANIKLDSVISDLLGVSGRRMLRAIITGEVDAATLANLALRKLRSKIPELTEALHGRVTDHHRFLLKEQLDYVEYLDGKIARFEAVIAAKAEPFQATVQRWSTIPGVDRMAACGLIAEIGVDMTQFPSPRHIVSWAGLCPGNNESAGKRLSGTTRKGNQWLRGLMTQVAWGASHTRNTYLQAHYRRVAAHRGKKRAVIALASTVLAIAYCLQRDETTYRDLGPDYFDRLRGDTLKRYLVRRLENLGVHVELRPRAEAV
jgi:transposase